MVSDTMTAFSAPYSEWRLTNSIPELYLVTHMQTVENSTLLCPKSSQQSS